MNSPLVSVLMTSYNREKYIAAAIESVLASTYTNFELIITDDKSSDNTVNIAEQYAIIDNRVRVFVNEKNLGDYPNRNKAASFAKGVYLKYVDADDYIYPWGLQVMVNSMEQFPEAGWGLCSMEPNSQKPFPIILTPTEIYEYHIFGLGIFQRAPLSAIFKTEIFRQTNGFSGKKLIGDFEKWHLLALSYNLVLMPQGMVWYRIHDEQQSLANRNSKIVGLRYDIAARNFYQMNSEIPLAFEKRQYIIKKYQKYIAITIIKEFLKCRFHTAYEMYKLSKSHEYDFNILINPS